MIGCQSATTASTVCKVSNKVLYLYHFKGTGFSAGIVKF